LLKTIDPSLGVPLPDKDYGGSCRIYDWDYPQDPFHNFKVKDKHEDLNDYISIRRIKWIFLFFRIFLVGG